MHTTALPSAECPPLPSSRLIGARPLARAERPRSVCPERLRQAPRLRAQAAAEARARGVALEALEEEAADAAHVRGEAHRRGAAAVEMLPARPVAEAGPGMLVRLGLGLGLG